MKTQRPTPSDGSTLASVALRTPLAELGVESDATLEAALGPRVDPLAWALVMLTASNPVPRAERRIRRLRGSLTGKAKGPLGALLDVAKTSEALARKLDASPFAGTKQRDPPTPEGTMRNAREELLEAVERVRYWSSVFVAQERHDKRVRTEETNRQGAPVEEVALLLESVALSACPLADPKTVATWSNRLARELRPRMSAEHFERLKNRARRALEAGRRPRLRWALDLCQADLAPSS